MSGSPRDIVREYFPKASDDEARDVLWGCTGWPNFFDTRDGRSVQEILREQLSEIAEKSGGDPFIACCMAVQEMDQAMERGKREREERIRFVAYLLCVCCLFVLLIICCLFFVYDGKCIFP